MRLQALKARPRRRRLSPRRAVRISPCIAGSQENREHPRKFGSHPASAGLLKIASDKKYTILALELYDPPRRNLAPLLEMSMYRIMSTILLGAELLLVPLTANANDE